MANETKVTFSVKNLEVPSLIDTLIGYNVTGCRPNMAFERYTRTHVHYPPKQEDKTLNLSR